MNKPIDQEYIYTLTYQKRWAELLDLVHKNRGAAANDDLLKTALATFEDQFFKELNEGRQTVQTEQLLHKLLLLDRGRIYKLSEAHSSEVVLHLVGILSRHGETEAAYQYAKMVPDHPMCSPIIEKYEASLPKILPHAQSDQIKVTSNANVAEVDHSISLFKSQQEIHFFLALRRVFPRYDVYPNVAISCLIDYDAVAAQLSREERDFFFKGIVDSVVFDQFNDYKPVYCFELDSLHHDSAAQKSKDALKDAIFAKSGVTLFRVRRLSGSPTEREFMQLILELLGP